MEKLVALPSHSRPVEVGYAALAGVLSAGAALGVGELAGATTGEPPSLVTAVGDQFVDRFAASLKDLAISLFGTNDKLALIVGIVIVSLLLGAVLGIEARRRFSVAVVGFGGFGLLGLWAGLEDPLGSAVTVWVSVLVAVTAGISTLWWLLAIAPPTVGETSEDAGVIAGEVVVDSPDAAADDVSQPAASIGPQLIEDPRRPHADRRSFLAWSGGIGAFAALSASGARALRGRSTVETERAEVQLPMATRTTEAPATQPFNVPGLTPYIVPNDEFYKIDTALTVPQVSTSSWRLQVNGMVDNPFELTYDGLLDMPMVEVPVTLACVSNEVGDDLIGNAQWLGVPLATLLERAGVQEGATQIVGESVDEFTAGFPTELAMDGRTALVALGMNGEPLPADHGYPARLVVSGLYGYVSATKWLSTIRLTTLEDEDGYWIPRGWSKEAPIKLQSRIDVPRSGDSPAAGTVAVAGVAWAQPVGVAAVEVRVDDGQWETAELGDAASGDTWVQWLYRWEATAGDHTLQVRTVGTEGTVQTSEEAPPAPDGATGWHTRTLTVI